MVFVRFGACSAGNVPVTDECGTLTDRAVFDKSRNVLAGSARRLVIEAAFSVWPVTAGPRRPA